MSSIETIAIDVINVELGYLPVVPMLRPPRDGTKGLAYIAGPMRGIPDHNFHMFDQCREALLADGYHVVSPADIDRAYGFEGGFEGDGVYNAESYQIAIRRDVALLLSNRVTDIVFLDGWTESGGASLEYRVAKAVGIQTMHRWSPETGLRNFDGEGGC